MLLSLEPSLPSLLCASPPHASTRHTAARGLSHACLILDSMPGWVRNSSCSSHEAAKAWASTHTMIPDVGQAGRSSAAGGKDEEEGVGRERVMSALKKLCACN